ncbi:MAG: hypothetical protein MUO19_08480, partial [Dehalococcoidales bacterium]|nr:hypothetical protein [Dehalococcoidales bacterium]
MDNSAAAGPGRVLAWLKNHFAPIFGLALAVGIMTGILVVYFRNPDVLEDLEAYGYLGAFIISAILNGTVLLPVSNMA